MEIQRTITVRSVGTWEGRWLMSQQEATPYEELRQLADEWNFK
jgi:hypothetical protein